MEEKEITLLQNKIVEQQKWIDSLIRENAELKYKISLLRIEPSAIEVKAKINKSGFLEYEDGDVIQF